MAVIVCPICSTRYRVAEAQLSKASRLKCKKCKTVFPVSDNIRTERFSAEDEVPAQSTSPSEDSSLSGGLDVPETPPAQESPDLPEAGTDEMTLDFNFSSGGAASTAPSSLDFSFSAERPETSEEEEEVELQDHISDSLHTDQGHLDVGLGETPFAGGADDEETTLSMDGGSSLDFSFNAAMPESAPEDAVDEGDDSGEPEIGEPGTGGMQDLSLGLDLGASPDDATMTMTGGASSLNLDISLGGGEQDEGAVGAGSDAGVMADYDEGGGYAEQEQLDTCCVDSLAMGMTTCELCGRDLQGLEQHEFVKERRAQLREELPEGETQIGFSAEGSTEAGQIPIAPSDEDDFTDVERALDALADGSFEKEIKKREAKKHRGRRLKMMGAGVVLGLIAIIAVGWMLLPSSHERLASKYENLMAQPEVDPESLVSLFLEAVGKQDQIIFEKVSVMPAMPDISGGSVVTIGDDYEPTSLGQLGKDIVELETELADLQSRYESTEKQWQEASAVDLSPNMIKGNIEQLLQKQASLQAEFDEKEGESSRKTRSLEADIQEAEQELEENIRRAEEHIDDTDPQGKAIYTASVRNQQSLTNEIGKLEKRLTDERLAHARRMQEIEAEYNPQFEKVADELEVQQALYEKALLYQDSEKSPLTVLNNELKELKSAIDNTDQTLQEKRDQLSTVFDFFKRPDRRQQAEQQRNEAEFVHVSKNVVANVKFRGAGKQKVPIVLKRYQAIVGEQTIQGDWVVEAVLR